MPEYICSSGFNLNNVGSVCRKWGILVHYLCFIAENYTENVDTLKITLKNNVKEGFTESYTESMPLLFRNAKPVNLPHFYPN